MWLGFFSASAPGSPSLVGSEKLHPQMFNSFRPNDFSKCNQKISVFPRCLSQKFTHHSPGGRAADATVVHVGGGSQGRPPDSPLHMLLSYKTISILNVPCFLSFVPLCFLFSCMGVCLRGCIITTISSGLRNISFERISDFPLNQFQLTESVILPPKNWLCNVNASRNVGEKTTTCRSQFWKKRRADLNKMQFSLI